jgi:Fanconi-associated nuclease 1
MDAFVTRLPKPQSQLRGQNRPDSLDLPNQERPSKRAKRQGSSESDSDQSARDSHNETSPRKKFVGKKSPDDDDLPDGNPRPTDIESALPPAADGEEAIEEYEAMKSSQATAEDDDDDGATEKPKPLWVKGRSSIYVDAFNLALDTVLDEESHLFDEKENDVFKQWRDIGYEAQYLYVLLLPVSQPTYSS